VQGGRRQPDQWLRSAGRLRLHVRHHPGLRRGGLRLRPLRRQRGATPPALARGRGDTVMRAFVASSYSLILVAVAWEIVARSGVVPFFFLPPLTVIAATFWAQVVDGVLIQEAAVTVLRAVAGFAIAVIMGITLGVLMARFKAIRWFFDP